MNSFLVSQQELYTSQVILSQVRYMHAQQNLCYQKEAQISSISFITQTGPPGRGPSQWNWPSQSWLCFYHYCTSTYANNMFQPCKHINSLKDTPSIPITICYKDLEQSDPVRKCDVFNEFFNSTFTVCSFVVPPTDTLPLLVASSFITGFSKSTIFSPPWIPRYLKVLMVSTC